MLEVALEYKRHFGFGFWLKHAPKRHFLTVVELHVRKKHSKIRRVDAELLLYGFGRKPYFATHQPPSLLQGMVGVLLLYGVRGFYASALELIADWRNCFPRLGRFPKARSHALDCFRVDCHGVISSIGFPIATTCGGPTGSGTAEARMPWTSRYRRTVKHASLRLPVVEIGVE